MVKHFWTEEENEWLKANHSGTSAEVMKRFNEHFGTSVTLTALRLHCQRIGISFGVKGKSYTKAENEWIVKNYPLMPLKELYAEWKKLFPGHETTIYGFKAHCRVGLKLIHEDPNVFHDDIVKSAEVGTEHIRNGYVLVKVEDKKGRRGEHVDRTNWQFKHRVLWEKYNGRKIRPDETVVFLDGDRTNFSKENLYLVKTKWMPLLNNNGWLNNGPELALAGIKYCELHYELFN